MVTEMAVRLMPIYVRNAALQTVGDFTAGFTSLSYREALNAPGGWVLDAPAGHPSIAALLEPGAGLVVEEADGGQFGGYVAPAATRAKNIRTVDSEHASVQVFGVSEITPLWWRRIVPPVGDTHDTETGPVTAAVPRMVARHLGAEASAARLLPGWQTVTGNAGEAVTVTGRYSILGEECAAHMGDTHWLKARWSQGTIIFSVEAITATGIPVSVNAGSATNVTEFTNGTIQSAVYGLGAGAGAGRLIVEASSEVGPWARIEGVHDDEGATDLAVLAAATSATIDAGGTSFEAQLVDGLTVKVGDSVSLYDSQGRAETVPVAETITTITPERTTRIVTLGQPKALGIDRLVDQLRQQTTIT